MARPIHQLLVPNVPVWMLEEIVKAIRAFFWTGKKQVRGDQCLVSWDAICQPKCFGGLRVKDLHLLGLALRARWDWLKRTDPSRPWQGLPSLQDENATAIFQGLFKVQIGNGRDAFFWSDKWIEGLTAADIAPAVVAAVPTRRKNARRRFEALQENRWVLEITQPLTDEGCRQCVSLWL